VIVTEKPPAWMDQGLCANPYANPEDWFPDPSLPDLIAEAACHGCPVAAECLTWALEQGIAHGTWGGVSETRRDA
jgi:WhiB family transcriptional regulator, redox-sensing transcriptional regulator